MADIRKEIQAFLQARKGKEVRGSMVSLAEKINNEVENNTGIADTAAGNANKAASAANTAARTTETLRDELQEMKDGDYWRGREGPQGKSGIMVPASGMFSLFLDPATGDLYADYPDGASPPAFEYDGNTGNLYYLTGDDAP